MRIQLVSKGMVIYRNCEKSMISSLCEFIFVFVKGIHSIV